MERAKADTRILLITLDKGGSITSAAIVGSAHRPDTDGVAHPWFDYLGSCKKCRMRRGRVRKGGRRGERGNGRLNGLPTGSLGAKNRDRPQILFVR